MKAKKPAKTPLASRLEEVRENTEGKPSQAAFATLIGLTRSAINQIDKGTTKSIKAETAFAIEDKTGFAARWVATGYGPKKVTRKPEDRIPQEVLQLAGWLGHLPTDQLKLLHGMYSTAASDDRMGPAWGRKTEDSEESEAGRLSGDQDKDGKRRGK